MPGGAGRDHQSLGHCFPGALIPPCAGAVVECPADPSDDEGEKGIQNG